MPDRIGLLVAAQLGRPPRGVRGVAVWCPHGFPAVIETAPYLDDGTPFPTLLYITCPSAVVAVSRVEAGGGVADMRQRVTTDVETREALEVLDSVYRRRRRSLAEGAAPAGVDDGAVFDRGIGGARGIESLSCLHAMTAALLAGAEDWPALTHDPSVTPTVLVTWRRLLHDHGQLWCDAAECRWFVAGLPTATLGAVAEEVGDSVPPRDRRAVIDLGTMSVRLLVADIVDGRPQEVVRRVTLTRLGRSLVPGGALDREARERSAAVVDEYVGEARRLGATSVMIVGTSATREASDGSAFVRELGHRLGVASLVIDGRTEARLAYMGATLDQAGDPVLVDIGGGSTELVARPSGGVGDLAAVSLPVGSVRSAERWLHHEPPSRSELDVVRREASAAVDEAKASFLGKALLGVAGTVTTLTCVALGLDAYDPKKVHLAHVSRPQLEQALHRLAGMSLGERRAHPCVQPGREEVILAGGEILLAVMDELGVQELVTSERDLLDGAVLLMPELQAAAAASHAPPSADIAASSDDGPGAGC